MHPAAAQPLDDWFRMMRSKSYGSPQEIRADFATASFLPNDLVVFNIGGNKYRLSVNIRYQKGVVYIRRVMTHQEYDRRSRDGTL